MMGKAMEKYSWPNRFGSYGERLWGLRALPELLGSVVVVRSKAINYLHLAVVRMSTVELSVYSHLS